MLVEDFWLQERNSWQKIGATYSKANREYFFSRIKKDVNWKTLFHENFLFRLLFFSIFRSIYYKTFLIQQ